METVFYRTIESQINKYYWELNTNAGHGPSVRALQKLYSYAHCESRSLGNGLCSMEEIFFLYVSCETGEETALQVVEFRRVIFEDNFL